MERSRVMGRVRSKDTKPEMVVRQLTHGMGYRYRLHNKKLPGCPDLVFRRRHKVIFVHGCFWHRHRNCPLARLPKSRRDFWTPKLNANRKRDERNLRELTKAGWSTLVIWECEIGDADAVAWRIRNFLEDKTA
jgi:DNA mismatch endonuclease (patch repair protein)